MSQSTAMLNKPYLLGISEMDDTHGEFLTLLDRLQTADKTTFPTAFEDLLKHTSLHFENENELMMKTAFPAISEHRGEHNRVLRQFEEMAGLVRQGRIQMAKAFVNELLPDWFDLHLKTMDSELARHLKTNNNHMDKEPELHSQTNVGHTHHQPISASTNFEEISPSQAEKIIAEGNPLIIDTRDPYSYRDAHIEGVMQSHGDLISHLIDSQQFDRPVIVYCYHGNSSKDLAEVLGRSGFKHSYSMSGGFTAWKKRS